MLFLISSSPAMSTSSRRCSVSRETGSRLLFQLGHLVIGQIEKVPFARCDLDEQQVAEVGKQPLVEDLEVGPGIKSLVDNLEAGACVKAQDGPGEIERYLRSPIPSRASTSASLISMPAKEMA